MGLFAYMEVIAQALKVDVGVSRSGRGKKTEVASYWGMCLRCACLNMENIVVQRACEEV